MNMSSIVEPELALKMARDGIEDVDSLYTIPLRDFTRLYGKMALREVQDSLQATGLPALGEMTIVRWPSSQLCMDCVHGCFLMALPSSTYGCTEMQDLGPCESTCDGFAPKENENEE